MSYRITFEVLVPVTLSLELESLNAESIKKAVLSDLEKGVVKTGRQVGNPHMLLVNLPGKCRCYV